MSNPFQNFLSVRRSELPLSLLMFGYFFLVITSFWILKPIKKALFVQFYDQPGFNLFSWHMQASQAELLAKVLNMVVAFIAVVVFTALVRNFRRQKLTYIFSSFFILTYFAYSFVINNPGHLTVWTFYLYGDLFSTLMVATFFAFLNDSVTPDAAKRLYGLIGLGGVTGGAFGSTFVRIWIKDIPDISTWLYICSGIAVIILILGMLAGRFVAKTPITTIEKSDPDLKTSSSNPAVEGAKLVFQSPYLLSIVAIVGLYEIVSTIMDFQATSTIAHYLDGKAIGQQFATVYTITNWVSMIVQLFFTSFIMTRFGLTTALLVLPVLALSGSTAFMVFPLLWTGSLLITADNAFNYSINQSAKETLYVPTTTDEKYKAKAFIDMFVQRFAKAVAVGISLIITTVFAAFEATRWLSLVTVVVLVLWIAAVRYAGRKFTDLTAQ